jgi:hypothetical protein
MCTPQFANTVDEAEKGRLSRTKSRPSLEKEKNEIPNLPGSFPADHLNGKHSQDAKESKQKGKKQMIRSVRPNLSLLDASEDAVDGHQYSRYEGPFVAQCAEDASIWEQYMSQAKVSDEELSKVLNSDLDSLLIFVSFLYSLVYIQVYLWNFRRVCSRPSCQLS